MHTKLNIHRSGRATPTRLLEIVLTLAISSTFCVAQSSVEYQRAVPVSNKEPVRLQIELDRADVQVLYDRDAELSIHGIALGGTNVKLDESYFASTLAIEQRGNDVTIRYRSDAARSDRPQVHLRINVPYRTEVRTHLEEGMQTLRGLLGPVDAHSRQGDIRASYISKEVHAEVDHGNLDFQVIGEPVFAKVGVGSISGERLEKGILAETHEGDINLMVVGSTVAKVNRGIGRIEVSGARGALTLSNDAGDVHVHAVPHNNWQLVSASGTIRVDLPPSLKANLEASTESGQLQVERDDISAEKENPNSIAGHTHPGSSLITAHTGTGKIVIR